MSVTTQILYSRTRQPIHLLQPLSRVEGRGEHFYTCQLVGLEIIGQGSTPQEAYYNAVDHLWSQIDRLWHKMAHTCESEDFPIRGRLFAWIDPFASGLAQVPERTHLLGEVIRDSSEEVVFLGGDPHYYGDYPVWKLSRQAADQASELESGTHCLATLRTDQYGLARGRVQSLEVVNSAEDVIAAWRERFPE